MIQSKNAVLSNESLIIRRRDNERAQPRRLLVKPTVCLPAFRGAKSVMTNTYISGQPTKSLRMHHLGETNGGNDRLGSERNELFPGAAVTICELPHEDTLTVRVQVHSHGPERPTKFPCKRQHVIEVRGPRHISGAHRAVKRAASILPISIVNFDSPVGAPV